MNKLIILPFLLISLAVSGTNYYVKNGGSDSNTGLSDAQAWAHHPWMSTWTGKVTLTAGDFVYMNKGDKWTIANPKAPYLTVKQSGTSGNQITTTCYGSGNLPIINISTESNYAVISGNGKSFITIDHLEITHYSSTYKSGSYNGIYFSDFDGGGVPHDWILTNCIIHNIPMHAIYGAGNCYNITIGDIYATSTATNTSYSNHIYDFGYAGVILMGVNPVNDESNFNGFFNYIHDATKTTVAVNEYGIAFTAVPSSASWPKYATARYKRVENIKTWEGLDTHGGSYLYFQDNYIKNCGNQGIAIAGIYDSSFPNQILDHIYVERNVIEQKPGGYITGHEDSFIHVYYSTAGGTSATNNYVIDNTLFYTSRPSSDDFFGIRVRNVDGLTISGNKIYNGPTSSTNYGILLVNDYGKKGIKNATIDKNFINQWGPGICLEGEAIVGSLAITNNIILKPTANACLLIYNSGLSSTAAVQVYNNTFIQDTYSSCFYTTYGIPSGASLTAKNNIFGRATSGTLYYWYINGTISGTFTSDYNIYCNSSSANPFFYNIGARNWTYWTSTLLNDTHSPNTSGNLDPKFVDAGGSYALNTDFKLQSTSAAINAGTNVGLTTDYAGATISGFPDFRILEHLNTFRFPLNISFIIKDR
jgi:hypothetical protein